eukprot:1832152-Rhodomonas_salina.1
MCAEAQFPNDCCPRGEPPPSSTGVTCPGQSEFCDCGGDCTNQIDWCACDEAKACCADSGPPGEGELGCALDAFNGFACLPTCTSRDEVAQCLENIQSDDEESLCEFVQNNILDIQSCFDEYGCCADWTATVDMYRVMDPEDFGNCQVTLQCPDLTTPGCGAQISNNGFALTQAAEQESCAADELVVTFKNETGQRFCTGLQLSPTACAEAAGWEYECQSDSQKDSQSCANEFGAVQRLCEERNAGIVVAADVERIVASDKLEYALTNENYQRMAGFLGLTAAWSKFDRANKPVLRVEVKDAPSEEEQWLCGGEPKENYVVIGSGSAASVVIPFVYLGFSTFLTMAGESLIDVGHAIKNRDFMAIGLVGLDGLSEVIGGSLFVGGLKSSVITKGKTID